MDVLADFAMSNPNLRLASTLTCEIPPKGWEGECGRIDAGMLKRHGVDFATTHFYFCGPKAFNDAMQTMLEGAGVSKERIHKEAW